MENIDIFDKFTHKQMNAEEILNFENEKAENPILKEEFELYKISTELIKLDNLKKEVGQVHNSYTKKQKFSFSVIRIAAMVLFGLIGYASIWTKINAGSDLLEGKQLSYIEPIHRGEFEKNTNPDSLYAIGAFEQLVALYTKENKPDEKFSFLAAMAHYNVKNYAESLAILQKLNSKDSAFKNEIPFYTAQCLVGLNKISEAIFTFQNIPASNPYAGIYDWKYKLKLHALKLKF
jgi:tetratricopeptide (TPR) repeat protein